MYLGIKTGVFCFSVCHLIYKSNTPFYGLLFKCIFTLCEKFNGLFVVNFLRFDVTAVQVGDLASDKTR